MEKREEGAQHIVNWAGFRMASRGVQVNALRWAPHPSIASENYTLTATGPDGKAGSVTFRAADLLGPADAPEVNAVLADLMKQMRR